MLSLDAELDFAGLNRWITSKTQREIPFATTLSLTWTAKDAQRDVQERLPERFTIRRSWVAKGIRIKPARKSTSIARIASEVGTVDDFMGLQEEGGTKRARSGRLAVPYGARKTRTSVTPRSKWPGAMLKKRGVFTAPVKPGSRVLAVWKRRGRRRTMSRGASRGQRKQPIVLQYVLTNSVRVRERWQFREGVARTVDQRLAVNFAKGFDRATR
ncbi:MAG: hypothetical protein AAGA26_00170 [Pseudomonadota bacterium]